MPWTLLILIALLLLYLALIAPGARRPSDAHLRGWLYAHRGLHDGNVNVPENSMAAFAKALEGGYGMELDVQLTRDHQLVVHHDGNLKRVCGVDRLICETDFADLPLLPDGSRIPLLSEVLELVKGRAPLIVEIKRNGGAARNAAAAWQLLKAYSGPYCVESFDPAALRYFRRHAPGIVRGQLAYGGKWIPEDMNYPTYVALKHLLVNVIGRPHFVAYSVPTDHVPAMWLMKHLFRLPLAGWTIRSQEVLDYARAEGYAYPIFEKFIPNTK